MAVITVGGRALWKPYLLAIAVVGFTIYDYINTMYWTPVQLTDNKIITWKVSAGETFNHVTTRLEQQGILRPSGFVLPTQAYLFMYAKAHRIERQIKAGNYHIVPDDTVVSLLQKLRTGKGIYHRLTIVEGSVIADVLQMFRRHTKLKPATYDAAVLREQLEIEQSALEGWFFPDTYRFYADSDGVELLRQSHEKMQKVLDANWRTRADDLPLTSPYQALILASIIEKETSLEREKRRVAAVFINRLKKNMRLQTDPTVIYGLGDAFKGNLTRAHLRKDTPYNTYTRKGLPPTPIALPSESSIYAATHPSTDTALYFVSKGDGTHYFSYTYNEHRKAVRKYQLQPRRR